MRRCSSEIRSNGGYVFGDCPLLMLYFLLLGNKDLSIFPQWSTKHFKKDRSLKFSSLIWTQTICILYIIVLKSKHIGNILQLSCVKNKFANNTNSDNWTEKFNVRRKISSNLMPNVFIYSVLHPAEDINCLFFYSQLLFVYVCSRDVLLLFVKGAGCCGPNKEVEN